MARRLVERGVRFVQLFHGGMGNQNTDTWDAHGDLKGNHAQHAAESDRPIAGLLTDLKARGLLDDDAGHLARRVRPHADFAARRRPRSQPGRASRWMAGGGIKGGQAIGATDEFGYKAVEQPISYHDLHATMLHLLGIDHTKLTYRFNGRDMRLTDVYGDADSADRGVMATRGKRGAMTRTTLLLAALLVMCAPGPARAQRGLTPARRGRPSWSTSSPCRVRSISSPRSTR